jgi:hypothetical protein
MTADLVRGPGGQSDSSSMGRRREDTSGLPRRSILCFALVTLAGTMAFAAYVLLA